MKTHLLYQPLILLIIYCILPVSLYGEDTSKHKVDLWLEKAMERNYSTSGMRNALNQARQMWDKEMNRSYKKLMKGLPANKREILKKSQRAWIAFRDADGAAIGAIISSRSGTMHQLEGTDASYQRVRDRALQLRAYEEALPK